MKFVCDAPGGKTWFRIETEAEALHESEMMQHAVEKYFRREWEKAVATYKPPGGLYIEQEIGLKRHIQTAMARFLIMLGLAILVIGLLWPYPSRSAWDGLPVIS